MRPFKSRSYCELMSMSNRLITLIIQSKNIDKEQKVKIINHIQKNIQQLNSHYNLSK